MLHLKIISSCSFQFWLIWGKKIAKWALAAKLLHLTIISSCTLLHLTIIVSCSFQFWLLWGQKKFQVGSCCKIAPQVVAIEVLGHLIEFFKWNLLFYFFPNLLFPIFSHYLLVYSYNLYFSNFYQIRVRSLFTLVSN